MFKIDPHALYSKIDLADALKDVCHVETFLRRVQPPRILKNVYYGLDIIRAINRMQRVNEEGEVNPPMPLEPMEPERIGGGEYRRNTAGRGNGRGKAPKISLERILI